MSDILSTVLLPAILAVHVALFAYYVRETMIGQPYWDMFSIITRYLQFQRDGNLWSYLWEPHVQHRQVWMRLLTAFDATVFSGVAYPFVIAAVACQLTTAWLLWRAVRKNVPGEAGVWAGCLVVMLVLTAVAAVDCALPMNGIYPQTVMFAVGAVLLFDSSDARTAGASSGTTGGATPGTTQVRRVLAVLAAIGAAFGNAAALSLWPILLWLAWRTRAGRGWVVALAVVGTAFGAVYLRGIPVAALDDASATSAASGVLRMADYLVTYMGLPWTRSAALAVVGKGIGALLLIVSVVSCVWWGVVRPATSRLDRIGLSLVALAVATAVLAVAGRSGVDADLRVPVRYSVFVALMHVGLLCVLGPRLLAWCRTAQARRLVYCGAVAVAVMLVAQQVVSGRAAVATTQSMRATLQRFAAGEETDDMRAVVYIDLAQARRDHNAIRAAGLYLYAR